MKVRLSGCLLVLLLVAKSGVTLQSPISGSSSTPPAPGPGLTISLSPAQTAFRRDEPILMRLTIENRGATNINVFPILSPIVDSNWPDTILEFTVTGSSKHPARFIGRPFTYGDRADLRWSDFRELPPLTLFGGYYALNRHPWAHELGEKGRYSAQARLTFRAKGWIEQRITPEKAARDQNLGAIYRSKNLLIDGILNSNLVIFDIR